MSLGGSGVRRAARHEVGVGEGRPGRSVPGLDQEAAGRAVREALHGVGLLGAVERVGLVAGPLADGDRVAGRPGHVAPGELDRPVAGLRGDLGPDGARRRGGAQVAVGGRGPGPVDPGLDQEAVGHAVGEVGDLEGGALLVERVGPVGAVGRLLGDGVALGAGDRLPGDGDLPVAGRLGMSLGGRNQFTS